MQIRVLGVPQTGAKSRVETQIKLCIQLVTGDGDKAQRWSHLKLPEQMVAKEKLKRMISSKMENTTLLPENMLYLSSRVICASDPTRRVTTCSGCVQREVYLHHLILSFSYLFIYNEAQTIAKKKRK